MRRLIARAEAVLLRGYNLLLDTHYYWTRGYSLRMTVLLARNTL